MVSWIELGNISTVVFSQDLKKKKCLEKKKSNLSFSKPVSAVLLWCSALKTVCHQKHLPMGWSCAYFYAETLFSPKVASKLLFQISTDHKANMALLRLRKTDSAKERGRFRSALFFQNTTGPSHRNSMPPKCTESKKKQPENLGEQKGGILPGNDSQITDWNQWYSTAVFQFGLCGAAVFVGGGFGRVFLFPSFFLLEGRWQIN